MVTTSLVEQVWDELLPLLSEVVELRGRKTAAGDLDVAPTALNHALHERERHNVLARWLPYFVIHAPNNKIVELFARLRGLEVIEREHLTPEEELRRLKAAMRSKLGDEVCDLVNREVYGTGAKRRR